MKIFAGIGNVFNFISEVGVELKKSAWPTRPELISSTTVVIISVIGLGIFIGLSDLILLRLLRLFL